MGDQVGNWRFRGCEDWRRGDLLTNGKFRGSGIWGFCVNVQYFAERLVLFKHSQE